MHVHVHVHVHVMGLFIYIQCKTLWCEATTMHSCIQFITRLADGLFV